MSRSFAPEAVSIPAARRFVRSVLQDAGQAQWLDEAQLAVSELCTNAMLHAHSPFEVTVMAGPDGVYVQVWDDDPVLPARRVSDLSSTTGRGLELLEAVSTFHGVQAVGPTKVVWFCLGMARPDSSDELLMDRWRDRAGEDGSGAEQQPVRVLLQAMPTALWLSAREHHNNLMREFSLHEQVASATPGRIPERLVAADRARSLVLSALRASGQTPSVDLVLQVRPDQAGWFTALRDVLDEAERLASSGELLAVPGPPAVLEVRRWACSQVLAQLHGRGAVPWTGPLVLADGSQAA